ncbi:hypothetical protein G7009_10055 [Pseudomonas capeferrum]|uniref:PA1571 family protein n=1 Tax=Pseudomonas capeferrum TaxID=1495066 RepID=UPI0015E2E879|nr:PA1571 family protein [Pseudomonas capeferrum]MBA1202096.1 hypothetical protein [Pseudomonas capeferrum]
MSLQHSSDTQHTTNHAHSQVCGSIIDAQGQEVPITEQMIQEACERLERSRSEPRKD